MKYELTEENFLLYAIKNYDNANCRGMEEFLEDLKRFKYLKRLLIALTQNLDVSE